MMHVQRQHRFVHRLAAAALAVLGLLVVNPARATIAVGPGKTCRFSTIQAAINAAASIDSITVDPAQPIYHEKLNTAQIGAGIYVQGDATATAKVTLFTTDAAHPVFLDSNHALLSFGGALYLDANTGPAVACLFDTHISGNSAAFGSVVYSDRGQLYMNTNPGASAVRPPWLRPFAARPGQDAMRYRAIWTRVTRASCF